MWRICAFLFFHVISAQYFDVPEARLQAFANGGFTVSIPDSPGIELFAFHGNLNRPLKDVEAGQWNRDIVRSRNGLWTFEEPDVQLKLGDIVYYWIFVQVDGLGYTKTNQYWVVSKYDTRPGDRIASHRPTGLYEVPDAKLEALHPKGFRVSIPDSPRIELFAFHGNLNRPLKDVEAGQWNRDIVKSRNGLWIFEEPDVELKLGDVIHYWIFVQVDGLGYTKTNQYWVVSKYDTRPVDRVDSHHPTGDYEVPDAKLEALYPRGLRVSIPDEPGVELFAFHGRVNSPLKHDLEAGTMSRDILRPKYGRWVFEDDNIRLRNGDVIYYWLYVRVDGIGHQKLNQRWIVTGAGDSDATTENVSVSLVSPVTEQTEHQQPTGGSFFQLDFMLPEGMELTVVVKDGKLLLKKPLPPQVAFENYEKVKIGFCKPANICVPSVDHFEPR